MKQLNWYQIFGNVHKIPDGRTVEPTDDIQIWLNCANIWDKTYTTLAEVLADTDTLLTLISSNNAVDYMVRSTTWAESIALVPTMTSDTTPSGVCSASSVYQTFSAYKAFDGNTESSNYWSANSGVNSWLQYQFVSAIMPYMVKVHGVYADGHLRIKNFTVQGSNDGVTFTDIKSFQTVDKSGEQTFEVGSINNYSYLRISIADNWSESYYIRLHEVQFYSASVTTSADAMTYIGQNNYAANTLLADSTWCNAICNSEYFESVLNVKVPKMTSNTTPEGVASGSSMNDSSRDYYTAFNGDNTSTSWLPAASDTVGHAKVDYQFPNAIKVYVADVYIQRGGTAIAFGLDVTIQASSDGVTYTNVSDEIDVNYTDRLFRTRCTPNNVATHYAMCITTKASGWSINNGSGWHVQFYGREDV